MTETPRSAMAITPVLCVDPRTASTTSASVHPVKPVAKVSIRVPEVLARGVAATGQRLTEGLEERAGRRRWRAFEVTGPHGFVLEGQVDDAVCRHGRLAQAIQVVQAAAEDLRSGCRHCGCGLIRAGLARPRRGRRGCISGMTAEPT